jgi:hypothetical protein
MVMAIAAVSPFIAGAITEILIREHRRYFLFMLNDIIKQKLFVYQKD